MQYSVLCTSYVATLMYHPVGLIWRGTFDPLRRFCRCRPTNCVQDVVSTPKISSILGIIHRDPTSPIAWAIATCNPPVPVTTVPTHVVSWFDEGSLHGNAVAARAPSTPAASLKLARWLLSHDAFLTRCLPRPAEEGEAIKARSRLRHFRGQWLLSSGRDCRLRDHLALEPRHSPRLVSMPVT